MARTDTGKWVTRAASTGGSRAYRGQRPGKWYASLVLIVLLGVALVSYSRYERQHPSTTGQPAVGTKWFTAIGFDICGTVEGNLSSNPPTKSKTTPGITTVGDGVLHIDPTTKSQAGANATLGAFVAGYKGLVITSTSVRFPGVRSTGHPEIARTFTQGQKCPAGTPDAGKRGVVTVALWPTPTANKPTIVDNPPSLKLGNQQLLEVAYLPQGASVPKPPAQAITAMLQDFSSSGTSSSSVNGTPATGSTGSVPTGSAPTGSASVGSAPTGSASVGSAPAGASSGSSAG